MSKGERGTSPVPNPGSIRPEDEQDEKLPPGKVSRKRFAVVFGTASAIMVISLSTFLGVSMVAGAMLGPGMGGFVAEFGEITYNEGDAEIYPVLAAHSACDNAPQLEASLKGQTRLDGNVTFYKDLPLPSSDFAPNQMARVGINAQAPPSGISVQDLDLRLTALKAEEINLGTTEVREFGSGTQYGYNDGTQNASFAPSGSGSLNTSDDSSLVPEFGLDAGLFTLPGGGTAAAHQISFGNIELNTVDLYVAIDEKSDFSNPIERVVEPDNRTCSALAAEQ
jgi:hypothetical protein